METSHTWSLLGNRPYNSYAPHYSSLVNVPIIGISVHVHPLSVDVRVSGQVVDCWLVHSWHPDSVSGIVLLTVPFPIMCLSLGPVAQSVRAQS